MPVDLVGKHPCSSLLTSSKYHSMHLSQLWTVKGLMLVLVKASSNTELSRQHHDENKKQ